LNYFIRAFFGVKKLRFTRRSSVHHNNAMECCNNID